MKRYEQNFKEEAVKLSDDIGVKKASEQLNILLCDIVRLEKTASKKE